MSEEQQTQKDLPAQEPAAPDQKLKIRLLQPYGQYKVGDTITATRQQLHAHGLAAGEDYEMLGTIPETTALSQMREEHTRPTPEQAKQGEDA